VRNGKTLIIFAANLRDNSITSGVNRLATEAFARLATHFKQEKQVLYIRDTEDKSGKNELLWSLDYNDVNEVSIGMPRWGDDETQIDNLVVAINQALFGLARRQHVGTSSWWFGSEALNRGFSAYYAEIVTGQACSLRQLIKPDSFMRLHMARYWLRSYDKYNTRWKPKTEDLWAATTVGLEIAQLLTGDNDGLTFCLGTGLSWQGFGSDSLLWALSHPNRRRSARIVEGKARQPEWSFYRLAEKLPASI
jgi:hypothetical protein